ncbi:hypothetical protein KGQ19_20700 [Catenulispora sp. NL8]|uniref:Uncharacterized protein n=1 Tax=Catenulispora pinistramenti TaxID=2705254 RepID=A0ABS5KTA7_9ACTN|nr:hypothetical protein [Catenulispora pinistramenti]MBS2549287.1 hypothetical protein [Catenulispora pinistramenti]
MAEASVPAPGSPREVLAGLGDLTRRVRTAQRGTWFPLLLLGLLLAGGIVVDRLTHSAHGFPCPPGAATGIACVRVKQGSPLYWSLGLVLVYAATAFFYLRRARSRGVPLLVLSWIERNLALLLFTVAYLVIELVPITVAAGGTGPVSPWSALPGLAVPAGFLLLGALAFAVAQRPAMPRTPAAVEPAAS